MNLIKVTRVSGFLLALAAFCPVVAHAAPITMAGSTWSTVAATSSLTKDINLAPFWGGVSGDCATCGIGYLLGAYDSPQLEYLSDGNGGAASFRFTDLLTGPTLVTSMTGWGAGTLKVYGNGVFTYDTPNDHKSNSWDNPGQYTLFRLVGAETTRYFLGIEDIPICFADNDHDYNDYVVTFTTLNDPIVPPAPVPEPSTLVLLGSAMAVLGVRRKVFAWRPVRSRIG